MIDLIPEQATYLPPSFKLAKIERPFAQNHKGRHAVRILKLMRPDYPGFMIEQMVLNAVTPDSNRNLTEIISFVDLYIKNECQIKFAMQW